MVDKLTDDGPKRCENCRFFEPGDMRDQVARGVTPTMRSGECRTNPPVIANNANGPSYFRQWPEVRLTDWCGAWKENDDWQPWHPVEIRQGRTEAGMAAALAVIGAEVRYDLRAARVQIRWPAEGVADWAEMNDRLWALLLQRIAERCFEVRDDKVVALRFSRNLSRQFVDALTYSAEVASRRV